MTSKTDWPVDWVSALAFALGAVVVAVALGVLAINLATMLSHL
ncbi:hypothetical protein [Aminobacter carboxidus]|nr:hypothetical protein [Aminobacter carboxidus]